MINAAVYVRISSDVTGEGLGVARQEADCRALAEAKAWTVMEVYRDNDTSAYSGTRRPGYERLLTDIEAGTVRAVVAWHGDRLHRSPKELERFIDLAERTGLRVETVKAGTIDLSSASGRAVARTLGAWARFESEHKSDRIRRKLTDNAAAGLPHGGMRPFGWEADRRTIRESEAAVLREAYARVLAGEPIRALVRDFNARGLLNASGRPWRHPTLREVLLHARHAGLRTHNGTVVGDADWPELVAPESWRALTRVLNDPARVTTPGRAGRLNLLSGIATCAVCGASLRVGHSRGVRAYRCTLNGCVSRTRDLLEQFVTNVMVARLSRPDALSLLAPGDDGGARREAEGAAERVRQRLDDAAASFAAGNLTTRQLEVITSQLKPELAALEAAAAPPADRSTVLGKLVSTDNVARVWESTPPDVRRAAIALLMEIKVGRARRGPGFDPDTVFIDWR
ncbi:MAG: recombinase family protein [Pseudonocardiales bacterium]|nr:recombinase family protein [Pseudonocardiales bacterium]MBV9032167.1 recombinase family protein [Pseudonocardiales bacterium]MBW0009856.1 recombinase family protein [Pseudonocardiales bacterium]